jgi:hypothetical protein
VDALSAFRTEAFRSGGGWGGGGDRGKGTGSIPAPEPKSRLSVKQPRDSKLLGCIIIFSGLKRNTNYSLLYQNIEIHFTLNITKLLRTGPTG